MIKTIDKVVFVLRLGFEIWILNTFTFHSLSLYLFSSELYWRVSKYTVNTYLNSYLFALKDTNGHLFNGCLKRYNGLLLILIHKLTHTFFSSTFPFFVGCCHFKFKFIVTLVCWKHFAGFYLRTNVSKWRYSKIVFLFTKCDITPPALLSIGGCFFFIKGKVCGFRSWTSHTLPLCRSAVALILVCGFFFRYWSTHSHNFFMSQNENMWGQFDYLNDKIRIWSILFSGFSLECINGFIIITGSKWKHNTMLSTH